MITFMFIVQKGQIFKTESTSVVYVELVVQIKEGF